MSTVRYSLFAFFFVALTALAQAQGLHWVTRGPAGLGSEVEEIFSGYDVGFTHFGGTSASSHWYHRRHFDVISGDRDGNGRYDDAPSRVDAICFDPDADTQGNVVGLLLSFVSNFTALDGTSILDGDLVRPLGAGAFQVVIAEGDVALGTGTSTIDLDAAYLAPDGNFYFSFADDELTLDANLIAANGGDDVLDESTVLLLAPSGQAQIIFTKDQILNMVSQATGANITSVVDTTGITGDPSDPSALWLTFGSANNTLEGRVFTTANGGAPASFGTQLLESATFGFLDLEILEGLAFSPVAAPMLALYHPLDVAVTPGFARFRAAGATAGSPVAFGFSTSVFPAAPVTHFPSLDPRGFVHLDINDPFLPASLAEPAFTATANPFGVAELVVPTAGVPLGLYLTIQALDLASLAASPPIAVVTE